MKKSFFIIILLSCAFLSNAQWKWAIKATENYPGSIDGIHTDFFNNIYVILQYSDTLQIGDTIFMHEIGYQYYYNKAIAVYNSDGVFLKALDIYSPSGSGSMMQTELTVDRDQNIYVCVTFYKDVTIQGQSFYACGNQSFDDPDLVFLKLNRDFQIIWANTVCGSAQDGTVAVELSYDNYIYLATEHLSNGYLPEHQVNFFNQDTAYYDDALLSIMKIDTNGNLVWRREIKNVLSQMYAQDMFIKPDSEIVFKGWAAGDLIIDNDTLNHPVYPQYTPLTFLASYNPAGDCTEARFIDLIMGLDELSYDEFNDIYFHGNLWEDRPLIFGNETIIMEGDTVGEMIGKMDSNLQPYWYHLIKSGPNQEDAWVNTHFKDDLLHFTITTNKNFTFAGINFSLGYQKETLSGFLDATGDLQNYQVTETDNGIFTTQCLADNCNNLLIGGYIYSGKSIFGSDTLSVSSSALYLASSQDFYPDLIDLGPDTAVCEELLLKGPTGYNTYIWNDTLSNDPFYAVTQTGAVTLSVSSEGGCWAKDTIFIDVYHSPDFYLGPDTTILLTDTLQLNAPDEYDHYLWSTGDTTFYLVIPASNLQIGNNLIWLDINNGPCYAYDTIMIKVVDNSLIQENTRPDFLLYPNPATTDFRIISRLGDIPESVVIYNCEGKMFTQTHPTNTQIDIKNLEQGVYIVELVFHEFTVKRRLIIL